MSLTISRAEGVTVYTVHSNHKSKWPIFCQILGTLCYSPVCSVSQRLKHQLSCTLTVLATIQIMVGIMNLGIGSLFLAFFKPGYLGSDLLWLGGVVIAIGILCILSEKFPSPCLIALTVLMNIMSAALAITFIVKYSMDLATRPRWSKCEDPAANEGYRYSWTTPSPTKKAMLDEIFEKKLEDYRVCKENWLIIQNLYICLDILMIVLAVLHLCVTMSWCFLNIKALCKKQADAQDIEDPELCKHLMKEENPDPVS
ncbi:uncharacterized protein LOC132840117 [Tachysurus vachellii]|uniref:uncharacterized protein LOC132840117 n=1 Tax=Tachysurus vachellii TaxID=175792 RepID=UPI00296AA483|nr:uncharacterized protein LOC132840117 [Tachysurus vachellii]XP_060717501.1 uncharacterized protein LOC132840117 [Tachysurus vachellii]